MIKRIIKTIICICLCFEIIYISYDYAGNTQVSDGSAFVTKSEMSYNLNNLSNRMLQLENTLDSRIDQLVSSYLTRNGIWNGSKQTLEKTKIIDYWLSLTGSLSSLEHDFSGLPKTGSLSYGQKYDIRYNRWTLINKCSKSGLLIGRWKVINGYENAFAEKPSIGTDKRSYSYVQSGTAYNNPKVSNISECSLWVNDNCLYFSTPTKIDFMRSRGSDAVCYIIPKVGIENTSFFVNKDDTVMIDYRLGIIPQTDDATRAWQSHTFSSVGSCPGVAILINDFYIY